MTELPGEGVAETTDFQVRHIRKWAYTVLGVSHSPGGLRPRGQWTGGLVGGVPRPLCGCDAALLRFVARHWGARVPQQSRDRLGKFGTPAGQNPAKSRHAQDTAKAAVWRPQPVWLVLHPVWGHCCLCAWVGDLWETGRDVALLGVTPSYSSAVCFGPCRISCSSEWCLPWQRREQWGHTALALLITDARIKCPVLLLLPGRIQISGFNLSPHGPLPVGAVSSGNFMEDEGAGDDIH